MNRFILYFTVAITNFANPLLFDSDDLEIQGLAIDLMHDDVIRPKDSMVVVVTLKSKMAASSTSSGENSKSTDL